METIAEPRQPTLHFGRYNTLVAPVPPLQFAAHCSQSARSPASSCMLWVVIEMSRPTFFDEKRVPPHVSKHDLGTSFSDVNPVDI